MGPGFFQCPETPLPHNGLVGAVVCGVLVVVFVLIAMAANGKHADGPGSKPRAPRGKGSEIVHNYPSAPADKPRF